MVQRTARSRAPANQEGGKSHGRWWNRESHGPRRDYSPALGRLIERDPIGFEAGDNNWYRFVANGPAGNTDPSGLWSWDGDWIQMGVGGLVGFYGTDVAAEGWSGSINVAIHKGIHAQAAAARGKAWRGYCEATNPVDAGANLLFGVGLNAVGEGFAHGGFGIAEVLTIGGLRGGRPVGPCATPRRGIVRYNPDFAIAQMASGGQARASDLVKFGVSQGWRRTQTATGPIKFVDENGITRLTIKRGSPRAPGSGVPHIEIRNASGQRIDVYGNPVTRQSIGNHTPIIWDLL